MSLRDDIKDVIEDYILDRLYSNTSQRKVNEYVKNMDDELIPADVDVYIDDIINDINNRIGDIQEEIYDTKDDDDDSGEFVFESD